LLSTRARTRVVGISARRCRPLFARIRHFRTRDIFDERSNVARMRRVSFINASGEIVNASGLTSVNRSRVLSSLSWQSRQNRRKELAELNPAMDDDRHPKRAFPIRGSAESPRIGCFRIRSFRSYRDRLSQEKRLVRLAWCAPRAESDTWSSARTRRAGT